MTKSPAAANIIRARQIGMLQVDLHHHSELSQNMAPCLVMEAKMDLKNDLQYHLGSKRLAPLFWAGDGGVFWIECIKLPDFDAVIAAGELVFQVLRSVNDRYATRFPAGRTFAIRVSGHFGPVLTVPDPTLWHSTELNFFAKNERHLSEPGRFSITNQLRDTLSQQQREKFPEHRQVQKDIAGRNVNLYFHDEYGATVV